MGRLAFQAPHVRAGRVLKAEITVLLRPSDPSCPHRGGDTVPVERLRPLEGAAILRLVFGLVTFLIISADLCLRRHRIRHAVGVFEL